jgi:hypothetical protein
MSRRHKRKSETHRSVNSTHSSYSLFLSLVRHPAAVSLFIFYFFGPPVRYYRRHRSFIEKEEKYRGNSNKRQ